MAWLEPDWRLRPAHLTLLSDEVHVWRASLERSTSQARNLQNTLAADELRRASQFHFQQDRTHFIVVRGLLRIILSRYLGIGPSQLRFRYSTYGKPALDATTGADALTFNMSHSDGLALYAVARGRRIGIDVERVRSIPAAREIAARFFSPQESAVLRVLPSCKTQDAFFSCWTLKEAFVKARGEGLSLPLNEFAVSLAPGEPTRLLHIRGDSIEASRWSLEELDVQEPGCAAALAVEGHDWRLLSWQWQE